MIHDILYTLSYFFIINFQKRERNFKRFKKYKVNNYNIGIQGGQSKVVLLSMTKNHSKNFRTMTKNIFFLNLKDSTLWELPFCNINYHWMKMEVPKRNNLHLRRQSSMPSIMTASNLHALLLSSY